MAVLRLVAALAWASVACGRRRVDRRPLDGAPAAAAPAPAQAPPRQSRRRALSADDDLVTALPGLPEGRLGTRQWAGLLDADKDAQLFYWLFEYAGGATNAPLVLWLNGGPGCSSMDGLWLELGPLRLEEVGGGGYDVSVNPWSWHQGRKGARNSQLQRLISRSFSTRFG